MTTEQLLSGTATAEQKAVQAIEDALFSIIKVEAPAPALEGFEAPEKTFYNYESTGGPCLGIVGEQMTPIQPKFLLDVVMNIAAQYPAFDLSKLTMHRRKEGKKLVYRLKIADVEHKSKIVGDITEVYFEFETSYDGHTSTRGRLYTERLVCSNGMVVATAKSLFKTRTTASAAEKVEDFLFDFAATLEELATWEYNMNKLCGVKLKLKEQEELICKIFAIESDAEQRGTRADNKLKDIMNSVELETKRSGATAFGVLQGVTHYTNHVANQKNGREEYITDGSGNDVNRTAQRVLFAMA